MVRPRSLILTLSLIILIVTLLKVGRRPKPGSYGATNVRWEESRRSGVRKMEPLAMSPCTDYLTAYVFLINLISFDFSSLQSLFRLDIFQASFLLNSLRSQYSHLEKIILISGETKYVKLSIRHSKTCH